MEQNAAFKSYIYRWHFSLRNFAFITLCFYGSCCCTIAKELDAEVWVPDLAGTL